MNGKIPLRKLIQGALARKTAGLTLCQKGMRSLVFIEVVEKINIYFRSDIKSADRIEQAKSSQGHEDAANI